MAASKYLTLACLFCFSFAQDDFAPGVITALENESYEGVYQTERFTYTGCMAADVDSFIGVDSTSGFTPVEDSDVMYLNLCIGNCYQYAFAAVYGSKCFCSSSSNALKSLAVVNGEKCHTACPGLATQKCGGNNTSLESANPGPYAEAMRNASEKWAFVTVYQQTGFDFAAIPETLALSETLPQDADAPIDPLNNVSPTPVSTRYTTLCGPPLCRSVYPSETATTILILSSKTRPSPTLTVPMSTTVVTFADRTGPTDAALIVPDIYAIIAIEDKVNEWIDQYPERQVMPGDKGEAAFDAMSNGAGNHSQLPKRTLHDIERRREEVKRTLLDSSENEVSLGEPWLYAPTSSDQVGKVRRTYSPFAHAAELGNVIQQQIYLEDTDHMITEAGDEDEVHGDQEENKLNGDDEAKEDEELDNEWSIWGIGDDDDEEIFTKLKHRELSHSEQTSPGKANVFDGRLTTFSKAFDDQNLLVRSPVLSDPTRGKIIVDKSQGPGPKKRSLDSVETSSHLAIKLALALPNRAKRQSPAQIMAASATALSYDTTTAGGVKTIGLESTQPTSLPSNMSAAPYPMGNVTTSCSTPSGTSAPPLKNATSINGGQGQPPDVVSPRLNVAHPLLKPNKFAIYALVTVGFLATVVCEQDILLALAD